MKKLLCVVGFLALAAGLPLWGYDTSPSVEQIIPEAIWAAATGGGTWVTELQITNFGTSAAIISVYFDAGTGSGGGALLPGTIPSMNSVKYANIVATIDSLDPSSTVYYGKAGGLWVLNTSAQNIQVHAQTVNGNYGKTFPGLNIVAGNSALQGRPMMIQGLIRNASYRTSVGVYNVDGAVTYTIRFTIYNSAYGVVGSYFEKTVAPYSHISFNPFVQAGVTSGDYDNCWLYIEVTTGATGSGAMFYASLANNYTNDTYALIAKTYSPFLAYETSPTFCKIVPEVIWAAATGGGTWVTEVEITNFGPTTSGIQAYFDYAGASRGPFQVHAGLEQYRSAKFSNILATIDSLDPDTEFSYYGRVGALLLSATDQTCRIQVQAKTVNGNFGKTFPGLTFNIEGTTAAQGRPMIIQGFVKNSTYRTSVGVYNTSSNYGYVARFTIFDGTHALVGSSFDKTLSPNAFLSFNPFTQAGITAGDYDNCWLYVEVISGGTDPQALMLYGSLANNYTNDTYALMAKQYGSESPTAPTPPIRF